MHKHFDVSVVRNADGKYWCFECKQLLNGAGYLHWVVDAKSFAMFCIPCSFHKWGKDQQYRRTEFAYKQKIV